MYMKRVLISEDEKKDILSKYQDDTDSTIMVHLRRNYPLVEMDVEFLKGRPVILVDDKIYLVESNKKMLVNKIFNEVSYVFPDREEKIIRRTIKKYLDLLLFA